MGPAGQWNLLGWDPLRWGWDPTSTGAPLGQGSCWDRLPGHGGGTSSLGQKDPEEVLQYWTPVVVVQDPHGSPQTCTLSCTIGLMQGLGPYWFGWGVA